MASQEEKVGGEAKETTPAEDKAEFSGAWDELEAEQSGQPAPAAGHQDGKAPEPDQGGSEAGQGEAQAGQPDAGASPSADTDTVSREISDDVLAKADPALKAHIEHLEGEKQKAQNLARINGGRLAKALNELAAAKQAKPELSEEEKERRAKLREDFGEVAGPILDATERLETQQAEAAAAAQARAEAEVAEVLQANYEALIARHPDIPSIIADPAYAEWVKAQTPAIQKVVADNSQAVVDAADAALVFDLYKASRPKVDTAAAEAARAAEERRNDQLDAGRTATGTTQPGVRSDARTDGGTFGEAWDEFEAKDRRKAAGRR